MSAVPPTDKETEGGSFKGNHKSAETAPQTGLMAGLLDKDLEIPVLKMLQELKKDMEKRKKMMCEYNGKNINRDKKVSELRSTTELINWETQ